MSQFNKTIIKRCSCAQKERLGSILNITYTFIDQRTFYKNDRKHCNGWTYGRNEGRFTKLFRRKDNYLK